jgi:hypothetical protein
MIYAAFVRRFLSIIVVLCCVVHHFCQIPALMIRKFVMLGNLPNFKRQLTCLEVRKLPKFNFNVWCIVCCLVCRVHFPLKKTRYDPDPEVRPPIEPSAPGTSGVEPISPPLEHSSLSMTLPPLPDPYEFSDEASINPATMTTRSRPSRQSPRLGDDSGEFEDSVNGGCTVVRRWWWWLCRLHWRLNKMKVEKYETKFSPTKTGEPCVFGLLLILGWVCVIWKISNSWS